MTGADRGGASMPDQVRAVIDFTEIYVLGVQPLTPWQREMIRRLYAGSARGE